MNLFAQKKDHHILEVTKTNEAYTIDGRANESFWRQTAWLSLDQKWIGEDYTDKDFSGRYKIRWNTEGLYLLVEVIDDVLFDQYQDPFNLWWDDDCVEVFVDADNSGGGHQYTNNAFAYHVSLSGDVIDIAPDEKPRNFKDHVFSAHTQNGKTTTWELKVLLFDDSFEYSKSAQPLVLKPNSMVGFALAYCDNDASVERENFIGSVFVPGVDKNQGWINADIFSSLKLIE